MPEHTSELTPAQVAQRSGLTISALHFYERHGLISSTRTSGNQRRYTRDTLRRLAFIRAAQRVGVPLAEIKSALDGLPAARTPTADDWRHLSQGWQAELDARITTLMRLRDHLTGCIGCGCLSLKSCQLYNVEDHQGQKHPGTNGLLRD